MPVHHDARAPNPAGNATRNAVCLCVDRNMMVPALYVAAQAQARSGARSEARSGARSDAYDVHIVAIAREFDDDHRRWMDGRGIHATSAAELETVLEAWSGHGRITPATLLRLVMPRLMAARYDRVLYLDADLDLLGPIAPLFGLDLAGQALAAVPAARGGPGMSPEDRAEREKQFRFLGMTEPYRYFNAGVMLIDVKRWNEQRLGERALDFVRANRAAMRLADEEALNGVVNGALQDISPIWNERSWGHEIPRLADLVVPVVRHFDGPQKPWKRFYRDRRLFGMEAEYQRYRAFVAGTPWQGWLGRQWTGRDLWDNLRFEARTLAVRLGEGREGRRRRRRRLRRRFKDYRHFLETQHFADVEQGIAVRRDGRIILNPVFGA